MNLPVKIGAASHDLFVLVKGLTGSEKSYYTKFAKRHADNNSALHLKLFKIIDESKENDDSAWSKKLGIKNKTHYSGLKTYLLKDILETIVYRKRNFSVDTQLYFMQEEVRLLLEKNALNQAEKICNKAISLAHKFEKYHILIQLLYLCNRVLEFKNYKQFKKSSEKDFNNLSDAIASQDRFIKSRFAYEKVRRISFRSWLPITADEKEDIIELKKELLQDKPVANENPLICLFYFGSLAACEYMLHQYEDCNITCDKILHLWKKNSHLINENPILFTLSMNTTNYNDFLSNDLKKVERNLKAYTTLAYKYLMNEVYQQYIEIIVFNARVKVFLKSGYFSNLRELLDTRTADILKYTASTLSPADQLSIKGSVCIAYFVLEKWDTAETLLLEMKEQNQQIEREDIWYFTLLFHLIILYEKKEWRRLESGLKSTYHFLYARKKLRKFEKDLMLFLNKLFLSGPDDDVNEMIAQFLTTLQEYKNDPVKKLFFLYFNYYGWLESKLMKISYKEYTTLQLTEEQRV